MVHAVGPWGNGGDVLVALLPIAFIVALTLKPTPALPTTTLPAAAALAWFLRLAYFRADPNAVNAAALAQALGAASIIAIIYGAVVLFQTMELTGCMHWITTFMRRMARAHPVAEAMLIGWGFVAVVEGASGFGTPVALASPILIQLGHRPVNAIAGTLILDGLVTNFGAVGIPVWLGLSGLGLSDSDLHNVGVKVAILQATAAVVVVPLATQVMVEDARLVRRCAGFLFLSTLAVVVPSVIIALWDYEFSSLVGGLIGFGFIVGLINGEVGLAASPDGEDRESAYHSLNSSTDAGTPVELNQPTNGGEVMPPTDMRQQQQHPLSTTPPGAAWPAPARDERGSAPFDDTSARTPHDSSSSGATGDDERDRLRSTSLLAKGDYYEHPHNSTFMPEFSSDLRSMLRYTSPLLGSILLLVVTRVDDIGLNRTLQSDHHRFTLGLGTLGTLGMSPSLVITLDNVLNEQDTSWNFEVLYQPFILPFVVVSGFALWLHQQELESRTGKPLAQVWWRPFRSAWRRIQGPSVALLGAMALVGILTQNTTGEDDDEASDAPAALVGHNLSDWLGVGYVTVAAALGALGSFFSGSTTVSNLTFAGIQRSAAEDMDVPVMAMLALQTAAAAAGNMICLGNIIAAKSVTSAPHPEGVFIRKTAPVCLVHCVIITVGAVVMLYAT